MIEKGKISAFQMGLMMYPTILATAILLVPAITAKYAERDMWISPILSSIVGFLTVYIAFQLHKFYPQKTLIQYSEHILGLIPGKVLGFVYLFFYLHVVGLILREYGEFVVGNFLHQTPLIVTITGLVAVCALAVHGGLEVIARATQIFIPIVVVLLALMVLLLIPELKVDHMLPVMRHGIMPSVIGAIVPQSWFSEFVLISFLLPYLSDPKKGVKWGMISVASVTVTIVITNLAALLLLGRITASLTYPVMEAVRYISIADFFEHLESIVMAIWVGGTFVKISVFYYALVLGTAQWLKLSDYRPIVLPLGYLLVLFGIWSAPNLQELVHFIGTSSAFYLTSIQTVIPLILLIITVIRFALKKRD